MIEALNRIDHLFSKTINLSSLGYKWRHCRVIAIYRPRCPVRRMITSIPAAKKIAPIDRRP
jgi:hypothetical protein